MVQGIEIQSLDTLDNIELPANGSAPEGILDVLSRAQSLIYPNNTGALSIDGEFMGGVSGAKVLRGRLSGGENLLNGTEPCHVVIKYQKGITRGEEKSRQILNGHIRLPNEIHDPKGNFVIYEFIDGSKVNDLIKSAETDDSDNILRGYIRTHSDMWDASLTDASSVESVGGYARKIDDTKVRAVKTLSALTGIGEDEVLCSDISVNGQLLGNTEQLLTEMSMQVRLDCESGPIVISHGDENPDNCKLNSNGEFVVFDHTTADYRSVYEPIAKILSWYLVTETQPELSEVMSNGHTIDIIAKGHLPEHLMNAIRVAHDELKPWISTPAQAKSVAAFMMMYTLREIQWLDLRGREKLVPNILGLAFSMSRALHDEQIFPLTSTSMIPTIDQEALESESIQRTFIDIFQPEDLERLKTDPDLEILRDELRTKRVFTFDLDGTTVGKNTIFPENGLTKLNNRGKKLVIASGAGPSSVVKKVGESNLGGFNAPAICNEGVHIVNFNDGELVVLAENPLEDEAIDHITDVMGNHNLNDVEFMGFYPSIKGTEGTNYDPNAYIFYIPSGDQATQERLLKRYNGKATFVDSLEEYNAVLRKTRCSKMVIRSSSNDSLELLNSNLQPDMVNAVFNEGYLNIVKAGINKHTAIVQIANLLDINPTEYSHFGNDYNDLDALGNSSVGFIVDSNRQMTNVLKTELTKGQGTIIIVRPDLLDNLLELISEI